MHKNKRLYKIHKKHHTSNPLVGSEAVRHSFIDGTL